MPGMTVSGSDDGTVRIWDLASGTPGDPLLAGENDESYSHLSTDDRLAISEILRETKPELWAGVEP